jgi:hypothetical protein
MDLIDFLNLLMNFIIAHYENVSIFKIIYTNNNVEIIHVEDLLINILIKDISIVESQIFAITEFGHIYLLK